MRRIASALLLLLLLCIAAFASTPEEQIMQADRDFNNATQMKRADGWLSFFALDDAALPSPPTAGRQAITDRYQKLFADADFKLVWDPVKAEVFPSGDMGYTTGKYVARFKNKEGKLMESKGRYITVWRKQADGSWKIITDTGGPDAPAQPVR
jgi:ketosteroid isomerase-like protein